MDELLKIYFTYNSASGEIRWAKNNGKMKVGMLAGYVSKDDGYIRIGFKGKKYLAHRLAWFLHAGQWPLQLVDHIDGNKTNNQISNLRDVSDTINGFNRKEPHGVGLYRTGKWRAYLNHNNKQYHIGYFDTKEEALMAHTAFKNAFVDSIT